MIKLNLKKAAMFGLDARIALAIFGSLSIISAAALYNSRQNTEAKQIIRIFQELTNAVNAYALDTKKLPPIHPDNSLLLSIYDLVSSTEKGWDGPYILSMKPYSIVLEIITMTNVALEIPQMMNKNGDPRTIYLSQYQEDNMAQAHLDFCSKGSDCRVWLIISKVPTSILNAIDSEVDAGDGWYEGKIRGGFSVNGEHDIYYNTGITVDQF